MKANAPEKLYLHPTTKGNVGASWLTFPLTDDDIEYTRTDAFIKKACVWISNNCYIPHSTLENFRQYMEGE